MKKNTLLLTVCSLVLGSSVSQAASILRVTEAMSGGDIADWFEITNLGDTAADITNYRVDDNTFNITASLALSGITSIAPGESVIFIEGDNNIPDALANVAAFKLNWSLASAVQVGGYQGAQIGFSGSGDGVTLFTDLSDNGGTEVSGLRVSFGPGTSGTSFSWTYDSTGNALTSAALTTSGTTWTNGTTAMLATPGLVPEPSAILLGGLGALCLISRRRRA